MWRVYYVVIRSTIPHTPRLLVCGQTPRFRTGARSNKLIPTTLASPTFSGPLTCMHGLGEFVLLGKTGSKNDARVMQDLSGRLVNPLTILVVFSLLNMHSPADILLTINTSINPNFLREQRTSRFKVHRSRGVKISKCLKPAQQNHLKTNTESFLDYHLSGAVNGVLLHVLTHVSIFNYCLTLRHDAKLLRARLPRELFVLRGSCGSAANSIQVSNDDTGRERFSDSSSPWNLYRMQTTRIPL